MSRRPAAARGSARRGAALLLLVSSAACAGCGRAPDPVVEPRGAGELVADGPPRHAVVWAVGDGDASDDSRAVVDLIAADRPDRVLYLGDVYEDGTAEDFDRNFAPTFGRLAPMTAPTPGNHEWSGHHGGYDRYWGRVHGVRAAPSWFRFRLAGWGVVSLNSEAPRGPGTAQHAFARRALRGPGNCRIAFWHRPRFSAGREHGDQEDVASLWELLPRRARIAISGHDHNLQRLRPIDGVTQFVSGAGGRGHHEIDPADERLAFGDARRDGALRLELRPGRARFTFVAVGGTVLDRGTIECRNA